MADATHWWVTVPVGDAEVGGLLAVPPDPSGFVVLVTDRKSSSESRIEYVAECLRGDGFGTLVSELLAGAERGAYGTRFDVRLLADRMAGVTEWVRSRDDVGGLPVGYFAAGTAAAAAVGAADRFDEVRAVVSLGGRVDRAESVSDVRTPTLLVVGGADGPALELNRRTFERLSCEKSLEVVPGAGHRFGGRDELERVAELACEWFDAHLPAGESAG